MKRNETSVDTKKILCRYIKMGRKCRWGEYCRYSHINPPNIPKSVKMRTKNYRSQLKK